jgi:hypothetical protein
MTKQEAEKRLAALLMSDMPVMEIAPRPAVIAPDWFARYRALRREFMASLGDSLEELSLLNLSREQFFALLSGRALPENCTLRLRVPLACGGMLETRNMFLCGTFPHSHNLDRFIIEQSGAPVLFLPNPAKKVYIPANLLGGGPGGNATEDRLAQIAAQLGAMGME